MGDRWYMIWEGGKNESYMLRDVEKACWGEVLAWD